jgi:nucleotide-binding universal stress UspA family protein
MLPVGYADPAKREKVIERTAAQYLEAVEKAAKAAGVRCKVEYVTSDYPAEAIVAAAKKNDCDLIFMSSHGRQGLRSMSLLGTQTQKVLSQSKIPVLVHR